MIEFVSTIFPKIILISHGVLILLLFVIVSRQTFGREIFLWIGERTLYLGLAVSLAAILGSLFYSMGVGFEPCVLCWWQRVFLYPIFLIFLLAIYFQKRNFFVYAVILALISAGIGFYQEFAYVLGMPLATCVAEEGACSRIYVKEFGYITIPIMSMTVSLYILALAWINRIYEKEINNS